MSLESIAATNGTNDFNLPENAEQFLAMKVHLISSYGVKDQPEVWYTIASHIQAQKAWGVIGNWQEFANVGRKVIINRQAQDQKEIEGAKIQAKLEEAAKKVADALKAEQEANGKPETVLTIPEPDGSNLSDRTHRI